MEKIHGTSAHISYKDGKLSFFAGGCTHERFLELFDKDELSRIFTEKNIPHPVTVYGEAYGGKLQGMSATYGKELKFIVFEVKIGEMWLNVPKAENFAQSLNLEFVHYTRIPALLPALDKERTDFSSQAYRNEMGSDKQREGIVVRPIEEFTMNNGKRVIAKYKNDEFKETNSPRKVVSIDQLAILTEAKEIATEWVTHERLNHILSKRPDDAWDITKTGTIISLMLDDILREAAGEIVETADVKREISKATALLFKETLSKSLRG
jgi:hypothetical protein